MMNVIKSIRYSRIRNWKYYSTKTAQEVVQQFNSEIAAGGVVPGYKLSILFANRVAIQDSHGDFTYKGLFNAAKGLSTQISDALGGKTQETVAYLCPGDSSHIMTQWAIWMSGNIAVPLSPAHPAPMLEYFLDDSNSALVVSDMKLVENLPDKKPTLLKLPPTLSSEALLEPLYSKTESSQDTVCLDGLPDAKFYAESDSLILYTSGTTSKPKGVVYGFNQIASQVASLHSAWHYNCNDVMLHALPLHHVHGQINSVAASLAVGARLRMLPAFNASVVWSHLLGVIKRDNDNVSVFMGVPTMYARLIEEYDKVYAGNSQRREYIKGVLSNTLRLMISGSAPLPGPVFQQWEDISGHRLLERYGMTEVGMALSNPYSPQSHRTPGAVGSPMPGVSVCVARQHPTKGLEPLVTVKTSAPSLEIDPSNFGFQIEDKVINLFEKKENTNIFEKTSIVHHQSQQKDISGELLVKGPGVFQRYWKRPEQTKAEFTDDGWFKTGDTAMLDGDRLRILGRTSVDIIKSGGYKISALDVETLVLGHPAVADAAVLGLPDPTWGEKIAVALELKTGMTITLQELQKWGAQFVPKYQLPTSMFLIPKLPRNAMGKVNKKELKQSLLKKESNR